MSKERRYPRITGHVLLEDYDKGHDVPFDTIRVEVGPRQMIEINLYGLRVGKNGFDHLEIRTTEGYINVKPRASNVVIVGVDKR